VFGREDVPEMLKDSGLSPNLGPLKVTRSSSRINNSSPKKSFDDVGEAVEFLDAIDLACSCCSLCLILHDGQEGCFHVRNLKEVKDFRPVTWSPRFSTRLSRPAVGVPTRLLKVGLG
jgi:hypothetical protein